MFFRSRGKMSGFERLCTVGFDFACPTKIQDLKNKGKRKLSSFIPSYFSHNFGQLVHNVLLLMLPRGQGLRVLFGCSLQTAVIAPKSCHRKPVLYTTQVWVSFSFLLLLSVAWSVLKGIEFSSWLMSLNKSISVLMCSD